MLPWVFDNGKNINFLLLRVLTVWYSTRGLGKALAREFLLSGDRVVVASRRWYSELGYWFSSIMCL